MGREKKFQERVPDAGAIAEFRDRPGVWLTFAGAAFLLLYAERLKPLGLKPAWVTALAIIAEKPGISQSALGRELRINRASSMSLANLLDSAGFIERAASSGRQLMKLEVTPTGRASLDAACRIEDELVTQTMGSLGKNAVAGFVDILKQVTRAVNNAR